MNPISTPDFFASSAPSGLPAIAVSQSADESVRLAIPENIRNRPRRLRSSRPGVAPARSALDDTSGNSTPERAVLLGKAGEISASTAKMLYDRPSVDLPKRAMARRPSRSQSPHFTTAQATRNATMMSTIVGFANPAYASVGLNVPESTAAAIARTDAVKIGNAPMTTER